MLARHTALRCAPQASVFVILTFRSLPTLSPLKGDDDSASAAALGDSLWHVYLFVIVLLSCAVFGQDKGGLEGIWVNDAGNVAETCMGNVAIVDQNGAFRSPPYDGSILAGTTLLRAFAFAPQLVEVRSGKETCRRCIFMVGANKVHGRIAGTFGSRWKGVLLACNGVLVAGVVPGMSFVFLRTPRFSESSADNK